MRVNKISIHNILGIEELEIRPGTFTVVSGPNASGKTSIIEALKAVVKGGHDATLLRQGAERGEVVFVLEDGVEIKKSITQDKSRLDVEHPDLGKISKGQTYIKGLIREDSFNPVRLLTAPKADRLQILMEALPMDLDVEKLKDIVKTCGVTTCIEYELYSHPLKLLDYVWTTIFNDRTAVNRVVADKKATISQLQKALPEDPDRDWQNEVDRISTERERCHQEEMASIQVISEKIQAEEATVHKDSKERIDGIVDAWEVRIKEVRNKIVELQKQLQNYENSRTLEVKDAEGEKERALNWVQMKFQAEKDSIKAKYQTTYTELEKQMVTASAGLKNQIRVEETKRYISQMTDDLQRMTSNSQKLTEALDNIKLVGVELASKLPIKGLEIREGEIYVDGIAFDRLAESRKVELAVEVAKQGPGKIGLICVDGLERLDPVHFEAFKEAAERSNLQLLVTRVEGKELKVDVA